MISRVFPWERRRALSASLSQMQFNFSNKESWVQSLFLSAWPYVCLYLKNPSRLYLRFLRTRRRSPCFDAGGIRRRKKWALAKARSFPVDLSYPHDCDSDTGAKSLMDAASTPSPNKTQVAFASYTESATNEATAWLTAATTDGCEIDWGDQKQSALSEEEMEQFGSIEFLYGELRGIADIATAPWPPWDELSPDMKRLLYDTSQAAFTDTPLMSSSITQRVKSFHNADWLPLAAHTLHSHVTKIALSPSGKTSRRNEINAETATKSKSYVFDLKYVESADDLYYTTNVPGNGHCGIYAILRGGDVLAEQSDWSFRDRLGDYKFTWNDALKVRRELHDFIMSIEADFHSKKTCPMYNWKGKCDSVSMYYGTKRKHSHLKDFLLKLWDPHYFRELVGKHVEDLSRWLNTTNHIPLFALWLKCTIFVYSKLMTPRKPGHYSDQTFIAFYCHDDNVQVGIFWEKLVAPFADSLLVFYQNKHYQQCRLHPDVELSQFKLVDYNSDDDKLIHGGNVDLCDSSTGSATPTQSKSTDNSDSDNPSVNDTPTQTVERTDNSDSDDQSVQSPYKNLKSPRRIVYDSDSSLQGQPEKKQKTKQIVIHRCPIGSPEQRKLANESDRTVSEFWVRDYKRNGKVYTEWRNDRLSSVYISCDLVRRLIYLVPTPHCTVTPFKCAWIPPSKVYDAMDIVNSLLKQGLPFFNHHLLLRSSYNWVKPVYEMDSLKEAMKLIREGNMTMDELFDDGTCGHLKGPDGLCIAKHKATRAKTDMIAYKVGACAHKKDRLSVCQTACYIGFMYSDITHMWNDDGSISKGTVKLWFQCDGNCVHSKTRDLNRLVGEDRQAVLKRHFLDEAEELSDRKAEKVFNRENGGTNPNGEGKIQTYSQVYKIKQEAKQAYKETKLGLVSKNNFVNFYKAISDVRIQDIEWRGGGY